AGLMKQQGKRDQLMAQRAVVPVALHHVRVRVLSGQEAGTAGRAEWSRDEGVAKQGAFSGDTIHVRGFEKRMSSATQRVPAQIIDQDKDDVGARRMVGRVRSADRCQS